MSIAVKVEVPWDQANKKHSFKLALLDSDGRPVSLPEGKPVIVEGEFEVGRPPGLKAGSPLDVVVALNIQRGPLAPDSRFEWRLSIDGHSDPDWHVAFTTRTE